MAKIKKRKGHQHGPTKKDIKSEFPEGSRKWAPLSAGFMIASIIGFFISLLYIRKFSMSMAVSFAIVFFCMFLASMISMARASPDSQLAARPSK